MERFPIGGEREPVIDFMRQHGFVMSKWSDKVWSRADGVEASIYGAGSRLQLMRGAVVVADGAIEEAMRAIHGDAAASSAVRATQIPPSGSAAPSMKTGERSE